MATKTEPRRVNFYDEHDATDRTVFACAALGWRIRDIAAHVKLTEGQVYYRVNRRLRMSVTNYRGADALSRQFLRILQGGNAMNDALTRTLRAAKISPPDLNGVLKP